MKQLEIDAGNTFVKWRWRSANNVTEVYRLQTAQIRKAGVTMPTEWALAEQAWAVSVAGEVVNDWLKAALSAVHVPIKFAQVSAQWQGLKNAYEIPQQMGVDRWVAMLAAWKQARESVCVVDAGSAVTVDFVDASGQHLGGYILPGLRLLQRSLLDSTAQVRWAKLPEDASLQLGRSTADCVHNGAHYLLAALLQQIQIDCGRYGISSLYLTGGDAAVLQRQTNLGKLQESLVLDGLQWLGEK